ncbi:MAG TPA: hypothetical protein DDW52_08645 [Planctomycetaceae bacterium]|nr:hypothetical protein [Planctomycetaceae bacterium]
MLNRIRVAKLPVACNLYSGSGQKLRFWNSAEIAGEIVDSWLPAVFSPLVLAPRVHLSLSVRAAGFDRFDEF